MENDGGGTATELGRIYCAQVATGAAGGSMHFMTHNGTSVGERLRIGSAGQIGIGGATYGSSGLVLTSGGSGSAVSWTTIAGGLSSDAQKNTVGGTNAGDSFTGTDANDNTLIGYDAGTDITSGDKNTALGVRACEGVSTGAANTGIGYEALCANGGAITGGNNTALGSNSLFECRTGNYNVAVGAQSLKESTANSGVSVLGYKAGQEAKGDYNTFVGYEAGKSGAGASCFNNSGVGTQALTGLTTGRDNVAMGWNANPACTTGSFNQAFGSRALSDHTTGDSNIGIGYNSGGSITSGSNNIMLGENSGSNAAPSGNVTTGSNVVCLGNNSITDLYCADTSISSSDKRDKTDVADFTYGLKWINQLKPVTYRWDKRTWYNEYDEKGKLKTEVTPDGSKKRARQHIGFLAQDVLAIEQADGYASKKDDMLVVNLNEDDTAYGLKYERLVPVLVNAIKELATKVAALEAA